jgi:hypothetical protein
MSESDFQTLQFLLVYADNTAAGLVYGGFLAIGIALVRYGSSDDRDGDSPERGARIAGYMLLFVVSMIFWVFPWNFVFVFSTIVVRWNQLSWNNILPAASTPLWIGSAVWLGMRAYGDAFRNANDG